MHPKPPMTNDRKKLPTRSTQSEVDAFLAKVAATPPPAKKGTERGRLIFAMDATASREPTWDQACHIQSEMFTETATLGGLDIQLCYYRGFHDFATTGWLRDAATLQQKMGAVRCLGGMTQIERVLKHAVAEAGKQKVNALVFVGDCMEENIDKVCHMAGKLGLLGVPAFVFHEGHDPVAARTFKQIAHLTKGAYCRFDMGSAGQLRDLLRAVAVYAAGGRRALEDFNKRHGGIAGQLTHQISKS